MKKITYQFECVECKGKFRVRTREGRLTGFVENTKTGEKHCYNCAAIHEVQHMISARSFTGRVGKISGREFVLNQSGVQRFPVVSWAEKEKEDDPQRLTFVGPDGFIWVAVLLHHTWQCVCEASGIRMRRTPSAKEFMVPLRYKEAANA
jgi:hypothetical protein